MKRTLKILVVAIFVIITGCSSPSGDGAVTVKVKAVEQVSSYTYLMVKGKGPAYWVVITSSDIAVGESITYQGGNVMENFYSKELDRTFEKVLFLDGLDDGPSSAMETMEGTSQGSDVKSDRIETSIETEAGNVSIAELYADPSAYEGKTIRVKGEVAKFNASIMERNWIHLQDGTDFEGKYDLTITSQESFQVGQVLTLEGIVALNRDFGYGYEYAVILEEATAAK